MRSILFSLPILLLFISCQTKPIGIGGLPFKIAGNEHWGLIGCDGKILLVNAFEHQPSTVVNGMFSVADKQGLHHLYNLKTSTLPVTPRCFTQIGSFREEVTLAQEEKDSPLLLINKKGEIVNRLDPWQGQPIIMAHNFKEGLALICTSQYKYGYIDTRGKIVITPCYDCAYDFSDGMALVGLAGPTGQIAYQVIDRKGETVFHVNLHNCRLQGAFNEQLLPYRNLQKNFCGYLNDKGETSIYLPDKIEEVSGFRHGGAIFLTDQGIGLIDKSGQIRIPANYEEGFVAGPERVALKLQNKWALYDFEGKPLCAFIYDHISGFTNSGYAFACRDSSWLVIDKQGQPVGQNKLACVVINGLSEPDMSEVFTLYPPEKETEVQEEEDALPAFATVQNRNSSSFPPDHPFYREAQKVLSGKLPELDAHNRKIILDYMERFRNAYPSKDIGFLEQVFSEDALIVVGKLIRKANHEKLRYLSSEQVVYNLKSKREYLNRLRTIFKANRTIQVEFSRFGIRKHPTIEGIYGVSVKQDYTSDLYSDEGYLFLLWDFRDEKAPLIHVRTWQPGMVDEHTPLPEQEIFNIRNFNIE